MPASSDVLIAVRGAWQAWEQTPGVYVPQLADAVVYIQEGHRVALAQLSDKRSGPWEALVSTEVLLLLAPRAVRTHPQCRRACTFALLEQPGRLFLPGLRFRGPYAASYQQQNL